MNQDALVNFDGYANVLIDTWWNVNMRLLRSPTLLLLVLIDTWWNVNFESTISFTDTSEF